MEENKAVQTKEKKENFKWVMLFLISLVYFLVYGFCGASISALFPVIKPELGWSTTQIAAIWGAIPMGLFCFTFIGGILLDRFSTRILMFISTVIAAIAIFGRGVTNEFGLFYAVMFMVGLSQAISYPGNIKVITTWFERKELFRANGFLIGAGPIGMVLGFNLTFVFSKAVGGWRQMYMVLGAIILISGILWLIFARDKKKEDVALNQQLNADIEHTSTWDNIKVLLKTKDAWLIFISEFIYIGVIQTYIGFAPTAIGTFAGATPQLAATTTSMGNIGSIFGYAILPGISDKYGAKKPFIWPAILGNVLAWVIALMSGNLLICGIFLFLGAFLNGWSVTGPRTMLQELPQVAGVRSGTALGMLNTFSRAAAATFPLLFAALTSILGKPQNALTAICCLALISSLCMALVKETGTRKKKEKVAV